MAIRYEQPHHVWFSTEKMRMWETVEHVPCAGVETSASVASVRVLESHKGDPPQYLYVVCLYVSLSQHLTCYCYLDCSLHMNTFLHDFVSGLCLLSWHNPILPFILPFTLNAKPWKVSEYFLNLQPFMV